jgi:putative methylase
VAVLRRIELIRRLDRVPGFPDPDPSLEQVATPPSAAAELLFEALGRGDLTGRPVTDLGAGTGRLAVGAALLGAAPVRGIEASEEAVAIARASARALGVEVEFEVGRVSAGSAPEGTVVMNPPFGAQRRGADRPFWDAALAAPAHAVYAFALSDSRTFIEGRAVARGARVEATRPVDWSLPTTFAHHRRASVRLEVDLWVLRTPEGDQ